MIYELQDLLKKMGAPEVREKGGISWHYFAADKTRIAGAAEIRLQNGGEHLIAELKHIRENVEDDNGINHPVYVDSFFLSAERTARPGHYRIIQIAYDGETYDNPRQAVIELGLGIFHARALDISVRMVEQTFNKQDILDAPLPAAEKAPAKKSAETVTLPTAKKKSRMTTASVRSRPSPLQTFLAQKNSGRAATAKKTAPAQNAVPSCIIIPFPVKNDNRLPA